VTRCAARSAEALCTILGQIADAVQRLTDGGRAGRCASS
jgi:hypothetical protein